MKVYETAKRVISEGHPYSGESCCEGNSESGPYVLYFRGVRWGRLLVEEEPNGDILLCRKDNVCNVVYTFYNRTVESEEVRQLFLERLAQ